MSTEEKSRRVVILERATAVFAERGYRQTDLQDIADQIGIGKGTIYRNFPSKEALFLSAVEYGVVRLLQTMEPIHASSLTPRQKLHAGIRTNLLFFKENPDVVELLIQERAEFKQQDKPAYFEALEKNVGKSEKLISELLQTGSGGSGLSVVSILNIVSNLMYGRMFTNFFRGSQQSLEEETNDLMAFVMSAIIGQAGGEGGDSPVVVGSANTPLLDAPDLTGEPGWTHFPAPAAIGIGRSFVSGEPEGDRIRVQYYQREEAPRFVGRVWFGLGAEGPPSCAHGGSIAAVLDEAMGASAWSEGHLVVAANLNIDYRKTLPLKTVAHLESWIVDVQGKKVSICSRIFLEDGTVFAEGKGLFIKIDPHTFRSL